MLKFIVSPRSADSGQLFAHVYQLSTNGLFAIVGSTHKGRFIIRQSYLWFKVCRTLGCSLVSWGSLQARHPQQLVCGPPNRTCDPVNRIHISLICFILTYGHCSSRSSPPLSHEVSNSVLQMVKKNGGGAYWHHSLELGI